MGCTGFFDGLYDGLFLDFMNSLRTHDAIADLYASWWFFKHISESMTCGLSGLFYFDEMEKFFIGWHGRPIYFCWCVFSSILCICLLRPFQPASYALGYLACDHLLLFSQIWPDLSGMMKKSAMIRLDDYWWSVMHFFEVFSYVITTFNSWINFK